MALPTAVFSNLFARLNVVVSLAIIGVSFYIFYNLLRNLSLGRAQLKAEMAALAKDVERLKLAAGLSDEAAPAASTAATPVAVAVVTAPQSAREQQPPAAGASTFEATATTDVSDLFEVVSISSNEIKDMLGGLAAAMDLNDEIDEQDLENFAVDSVLAEAISAAAPSPSPSPTPATWPSEADVKNMKVEELRELGARLGLESTRGSKGQLLGKVLAELAKVEGQGHAAVTIDLTV